MQSGKLCLGEIIYRYVTADQFSPECLLDCLDLSSEHHTLEIANRIEAAVHVWRLKGNKKQSLTKPKPKPKPKKPSSSWGGKVKGLVGDADRNSLLSQRAEGLLLSLRLRYPRLPQTVLDMNKIQYNKVGFFLTINSLREYVKLEGQFYFCFSGIAIKILFYVIIYKRTF